MNGEATDKNGCADPAFLAKAQLRTDLRSAMRERDAQRVRAIRSLIAALDNAEAVPPSARHEKYVVSTFGDGSAEVPRVVLSSIDVEGVLRREAEARRTSAATLSELGKPTQAAELLEEFRVIEHYLRLSS